MAFHNLGKNCKTGPEYYPLEFCNIVARQPVRGKLSDREVAAMIRTASQPADETFKKIRDTMKDVRECFDSDLASIGLQVHDKMTEGTATEINYYFFVS